MPKSEAAALTNRGGARPGAGRKPLPGGTVRRLYALTPLHVDLLDQYRQRHSLTSMSAAMRHLIESVHLSLFEVSA